MNVAELIEELKQFPPEVEVAIPLNSDYQLLEKGDPSLVRLVDQGYYLMSYHPTMSQENYDKLKDYLLI